MGKYVDGFVLAVPKNKVDDYRKIARKAGKVWKEYGALEYKECIAEDVPKGKLTSFPLSVKAKRNETVVFAWVVFESREQRDLVNARIAADPRLGELVGANPPFDMRRIAYGGFAVLVRG